MEALYIFLLPTVFICTGCLHAPPSFPGSRSDNLDPQDYVNAECEDLSGSYEGKCEIVDGDPNALRFSRNSRLDHAFPFANKQELAVLSAAARRNDGFNDYPVRAVVKRVSRRTYQVTFSYPNGQTAGFVPSFDDVRKYVCTGASGRIVWGGGGLESRSESGPNKSDFSEALYLDHQGNLIQEKKMQVHMSLRIGNIPVGTAQHYATYRFRKLQQ